MTRTLVDGARAHVRSHFQWIDADADVWTMLQNGASLAAIVQGLASMAVIDRPDLIIGIESRGFVLAPAVAIQLCIGFVAVRKDGATFPRPVIQRQTEPDYRGNRRTLSVRCDHVPDGARLVLVDDWVETGSQARTVSLLVDEIGARVVSLATIIDETNDTTRDRLPPIRGLLTGNDVP